MSEDKQTILIVEDDLDVAEMLNAYFRAYGYQVLTVNWGEDAVRACRSTRPDLIILDIRLPDIDGYEVARRIRGTRRLSDIPIIFLTERRGRSDRLQGLELGADDYITKPFDVQELRLRVRNALRRATQGALINPVTGLAEGPMIDERLSECLIGASWGLMIVSLDHLDDFREAYGFVASDDVLRAFSLMTINALRESGATDDFIGHLSNTDLVIISGEPDKLTALEEHIRGRLEPALVYFYPLKDRPPETIPGARLGIRIGALNSAEGETTSLDQLKTALLQQRK